MREKVRVYVEVLDENVELPKYSNPNDSGMDIRANADVEIKPQQTLIIPTGLKVSIPEGYEIQVRARSGLSLKTPLRIANGIGTIDCSYKNELGIIAHNSADVTIGSNIIINKGDRIAQLVLQKVPMIEWNVVDDINKYGADRNGGFGSTGIK